MTSVVLHRTRRFSVYSDPVTCPGEWVVVDLCCAYSKQLMLEALQEGAYDCTVIHEVSFQHLSRQQMWNHPVLQLSDFESIAWESVLDGRDGAAAFIVRKGLSRKAQFALQCRKFASKCPLSTLARSIPPTQVVDVWSAYETMTFEFGYGLRCSFDDHLMRSTPIRNKLEYLLDDIHQMFLEKQDWTWILKPSVVNKGLGIQIVRNWDEFIAALESAHDIREWVLQKYISNPLLIYGHKFHIRTYVLCVGALKVFVFEQMLLLFAAHK